MDPSKHRARTHRQLRARFLSLCVPQAHESENPSSLNPTKLVPPHRSISVAAILESEKPMSDERTQIIPFALRIPIPVLIQAYILQTARADSAAEDIVVAVAHKVAPPFFFEWCGLAMDLGLTGAKLVEWHKTVGNDTVETIISVLGRSIGDDSVKQAEFVLRSEKIRAALR